jgi:hypothetical protein
LQAGGRRFDPGHVHQHPAAFQALPNSAFVRLPQLGSFGSNKKLPDFCDRPALLIRNRVQIDLSCELLPVKQEVAGSSPAADYKLLQEIDQNEVLFTGSFSFAGA